MVSGGRRGIRGDLAVKVMPYDVGLCHNGQVLQIAYPSRAFTTVNSCSKHILTPALVVEERKNQPQDDDDDTPTSRFTERLIRFLLKGFIAKDKTVRYRVVHLVAEMVASLGEIEYVSLSRTFSRIVLLNITRHL